jgi:hypothetical protein
MAGQAILRTPYRPGIVWLPLDFDDQVAGVPAFDPQCALRPFDKLRTAPFDKLRTALVEGQELHASTGSARIATRKCALSLSKGKKTARLDGSARKAA